MQEAATRTCCPASGGGSIAPSPRRWRRGPVGAGADAAAHWAELAYHWSATRDDARALDLSVRAAIAAVQAYAFGDALRHFETAIDLWSGVDEPETVARVTLASLLDQASTIASLDGQTRRGRPCGRPRSPSSGRTRTPRSGRYGWSAWADNAGSRPIRWVRFAHTRRRWRSSLHRAPPARGCSPATARC